MGSNEVEFFKKQMTSNVTRASQGNVVLTHFLDEQKQALLENLKTPDVDIHFDGGFDQAEHQRALFMPKGWDFNSFKIKVYEISYNPRYLTLNHRKVLGTILGLGIERECVGDILFQKNRAYFACTEEISSYLVQSFTQISGIPISLKEIKERFIAEKNLKDEVHIVTSLRLDVLVASAYHLSRTDVQKLILNGLVLLNHMECTNSSKIIQKNDIISVRHKGRFCLKDIEGKTKSDRNKVILSYWV